MNGAETFIYVEKMDLDPYHTLYTKINSKSIKHLYIQGKQYSFLEENVGGWSLDLKIQKNILNNTQKFHEEHDLYF